MNVCTVEQKVLFLFVIRQCLTMSLVLNVCCVQVVSGINLFIHPLRNVVPFKVVSEPDDGAFCELCYLNLIKFALQCCSTHSDIKSLLPFNTMLSFGKARSHTA